MAEEPVKKGPSTGMIVLIVIVALGVGLAFVAVPNFLRFNCRAAQGEAKRNLLALSVAQDSYRKEYGHYGALLEIGWEPQGFKLRYDYELVLRERDQYFARARSRQDAVYPVGDEWTIDDRGIPKNPIDGCR
jgi:type II secretory pathway pseudopilin PulG